MSSQNNERIIQKIKKLLALANSNNPHEAANAMAKAQKLMELHQIDMKMVELADFEKSTFVMSTGKLQAYESGLLAIEKRAFGVECIIDWEYKRSSMKAKPTFFGLAPQPKLASYCMEVLYSQLKKSRSDYVKTLNKNCKRTTKIKRGDAFAMAWVQSVYTKVHTFAMSEEYQAALLEYKNTVFDETIETKSKDRTKGKADIRDAISGRRAAAGVRLDRPVNGQETPKLSGANL